MDAPVITATAKGPNQINLTWPAVTNPGWGYKVEIQSDGDSRYSSWTELPITRDGRNWLPYWVTEAHYTDITDGTGTSMGSAAKFQMYGLKYGTTYNFRVRTYAKNDSGTEVFGSYSNTASATTTTPGTIRYVVPGGAGSQNGTSWANAWPKVSSANGVAAGTLVLVGGGTYSSDSFIPVNSGTQANRTVIQANYGETPTITTSNAPGGQSTIYISSGRNYLILDGINVDNTDGNGPRVNIGGQRNAIVNAEIDAGGGGWLEGIYITNGYNLVHYSYVHDAGQWGLDDGSTIVTIGSSSDRNVIQYSHSQRGGHDTGLTKEGSDYNQWKNNLFDGGMGLGWEATGAPNCQYNLIEGNVFKDVNADPQHSSLYKPGIEVSAQRTTVRRNVFYGGDDHGIEISGVGGDASNNLIYNNVIYNNGGIGITSFTTATNGVYANNIIYANENAGNEYSNNRIQSAMVDTYTGSVWRNNLILDRYLGVEYPNNISCWRDWGGSGRTTVGANTDWPTFYQNNVTTTPNVIDLASNEFHLQSTSGLRGIGVAVTDTQWGTTNELDIGAFKWFDPTGAGPSPPAAPTNLRLVP